MIEISKLCNMALLTAFYALFTNTASISLEKHVADRVNGKHATAAKKQYCISVRF